MKNVWIVFCENKIYREILGAYSTYEKAQIALLKYREKFPICGSYFLNFYEVMIRLDIEEITTSYPEKQES